MIWIIGSKGMLARDVIALCKESGFELLESDIEVDITDYGKLRAFAQNNPVSAIVNCSAYTAVDRAEDEPDRAFLINETGTENIATVARNLNVPLIHISTDYVFDGKDDSPIDENAVPSPSGVYGASKLSGEEKVRAICSRYFIIRTAWLYGQGGNNFVATMLRLMNEREQIGVVADQWGSPTWSIDLARFITSLLLSQSEKYGTYHFSGEGKINWYQFALEIYQLGKKYALINNDCIINPISTAQYPTKAKRPEYSYLSKEKIKNVLNYEPPEWKESLELFLGSLVDNRAE